VGVGLPGPMDRASPGWPGSASTCRAGVRCRLAAWLGAPAEPAGTLGHDRQRRTRWAKPGPAPPGVYAKRAAAHLGTGSGRWLLLAGSFVHTAMVAPPAKPGLIGLDPAGPPCNSGPIGAPPWSSTAHQRPRRSPRLNPAELCPRADAVGAKPGPSGRNDGRLLEWGSVPWIYVLTRNWFLLGRWPQRRQPPLSAAPSGVEVEGAVLPESARASRSGRCALGKWGPAAGERRNSPSIGLG